MANDSRKLLGGKGVSHTECASCRAAAPAHRCSGCGDACYCSRQCQQQHWAQGHKHECKKLRKQQQQAEQLGPDARAVTGAKEAAAGGISSAAQGKGSNSLPPIANQVLFPDDRYAGLAAAPPQRQLPLGLHNVGNSCYANSLLQALLATPPLAAYLVSGEHGRGCLKASASDWCVLCELESLAQGAYSGDGSASILNPRPMLRHVKRLGKQFTYGRQEDSHELYLRMLEAVEAVQLREVGGSARYDPRSRETTFIHRVFAGYTRNQVECRACGHISRTYECCSSLTLEVSPRIASLEAALRSFTAVERLDGANRYKCDGCHAYVAADKSTRLEAAPHMLQICLKRFAVGRFSKITSRLSFPEQLDLAPYMAEGCLDSRHVQYSLYAVVVHIDHSRSTDSGHYIAYVKSGGSWYRCDDARVTPVGVAKVLAAGAYLLFYQRDVPRPIVVAAGSSTDGDAPGAATRKVTAGDAGDAATEAGHSVVSSSPTLQASSKAVEADDRGAAGSADSPGSRHGLSSYLTTAPGVAQLDLELPEQDDAAPLLQQTAAVAGQGGGGAQQQQAQQQQQQQQAGSLGSSCAQQQARQQQVSSHGSSSVRELEDTAEAAAAAAREEVAVLLQEQAGYSSAAATAASGSSSRSSSNADFGSSANPFDLLGLEASSGGDGSVSDDTEAEAGLEAEAEAKAEADAEGNAYGEVEVEEIHPEAGVEAHSQSDEAQDEILSSSGQVAGHSEQAFAASAAAGSLTEGVRPDSQASQQPPAEMVAGGGSASSIDAEMFERRQSAEALASGMCKLAAQQQATVQQQPAIRSKQRPVKEQQPPAAAAATAAQMAPAVAAGTPSCSSAACAEALAAAVSRGVTNERLPAGESVCEPNSASPSIAAGAQDAGAMQHSSSSSSGVAATTSQAAPCTPKHRASLVALSTGQRVLRLSVTLPGVQLAAQVDWKLEGQRNGVSQHFSLRAEQYALRLPLPVPVNGKEGAATWAPAGPELVVTWPVFLA